MADERTARVTTDDMDAVDRIFQELLDRREQSNGIREDWERENGIQPEEEGGLQRNPYSVDPQLFWMMATIEEIEHSQMYRPGTRYENGQWHTTEPERKYEDTYRQILRDFSGKAAATPEEAEKARTNRGKWVASVFRFIDNTQMDSLTAEDEDDIRKFFLLSQTYQHVSDLRAEYPGVYHAAIGQYSDEEDHFRVQMNQARALSQRMQVAMEGYFNDPGMRGIISDDDRRDRYRGSRQIADISTDRTAAEYLAPMTEELNAQFARKYEAAEEAVPGVTLRVPAVLSELADFEDDSLDQLPETAVDLSRKMVQNIYESLTPEGIRHGSVIRGGKSAQVMEEEDLIFINGQSLREYTIAHLPENRRTEEAVSDYSGAYLARAMQEGTNRISLAQVSGREDGGYKVTVHPVSLDLRECQPDIENDRSYGYIHRTYFNWGPFKCKTRQEKAEKAYSDPKLTALQEGLSERLDKEIADGIQDRIFLDTRDLLARSKSITGRYVNAAGEELGTEYADKDLRDLQPMACIFLLGKENLSPNDRERSFEREMEEMVRAFYSPDMEKRTKYLDKMADFVDQFDPDNLDLSKPEDILKLNVYEGLSQTVAIKARDYPEWFNNRYPTAAARERYAMKGNSTDIEGARWQKRGKELTGRMMNIAGSSFASLDYDALESLQDFDRRLLRKRIQNMSAGLKLPPSAAQYMNMSKKDFTQFDEFSLLFVSGLLHSAVAAPEARNILGMDPENLFYVDGVSLKEYADGLMEGQGPVNYNRILLNAMMNGGHMIDMARLKADPYAKADKMDAAGEWDLEVIPIRLDLNACEMKRKEDGMTNAEKTEEMFADDVEKIPRMKRIREDLKPRLEAGVQQENARLLEAGEPLVRLDHSLKIAQNLPVQSWDDLRAVRERQQPENQRLMTAENNRPAPQAAPPAQDEAVQEVQNAEPAVQNEAPAPQGHNGTTRHAMNFDDLVEEAEEAGEIRQTVEFTRVRDDDMTLRQPVKEEEALEI